MAPPKPKEETEEYLEEREKFLATLQEYHNKRGTTFERAPKVGSVNLDLLALYNRVLEEGGYDKTSDTRGNKLAWRKIATEFLPHSASIVTLAFQVKTAYYKNLAAYEISVFHKKEPPPKEILEELTAKGGDLLTRTLDNYHRRATKEIEDLKNGVDSGSDNENTPRGDKMDLDDTPGSGVRVTRAGLRHAPPQRVLFGQHADSLKVRTAGSHNSPTPGQPHSTINGTYGSSAAVSTLANYEPRVISALNVKAVVSPANNPQHFKDLAKRQKELLRRHRGLNIQRGMMLPGTGYPGPNIYIRCLYALQSGVPAEIKYALHHLVKISFERGDKFRFDQFVNLADNLMQIVCSVSTIWYDHPGWEYSWKDQESEGLTTLNQLIGTTQLLRKIHSFNVIKGDTLHTTDWNSKISDVSSAALVIRNMVMLEENAKYIASARLVRDMITILLQLPASADTVEVKYYALEIAEQLTRFWTVEADDSLYASLIQIVEKNLYDRGIIISGLRALSRISMDLEVTNRLQNIPASLLTHVYQWLLVEDEDLRGACTDFLYQYTAVTENVQYMVTAMDTESLVEVLMQFLTIGAVRVSFQVEPELKPQTSQSQPTAIAESLPKLAPSIVEKLCQISDPKEQSSAWLRTCFIEDPEGEITQLALWSAYNEAFNSLPGEAQLMVAKDFITNVSNVFPKAVARVVPHEHDRSKSKYTMKGISPRAIPLDFRGRPYVKCMWQIPVAQSTEAPPPVNTPDSLHKDCDLWFSPSNAEEMWNHIVETHIEIPRDSDNPRKFNDAAIRGTGRKFACLWAGCSRFPPHSVDDPYKICVHVKSHLPDHGPGAALRAKYTKDPSAPTTAPKLDFHYMNTPIDESGHPVGLPLAGMLVLRNLARQMLKIDDAAAAQESEGGKRKHWDSLVDRHFALFQEKIFEVLTYNYSLRHYTPEFIRYVSKGIEKANKKQRLSTD